jgi:hypothetical protein
MSRAKFVLLPALCVLAIAVGTPAMALNPQPLPPGFKQPTTFQSGKHFVRKAGRTALLVKPSRSHAHSGGCD